MTSRGTRVVLAFSGGLDTSYCAAMLAEQGALVTTVFVDTGGGDETTRRTIEERALELGAVDHRTIDASHLLWDTFVVPFIMGGELYEGSYPLLCSDRYAIAAATVDVAREIGADAVAHGCTAMGNDQVRFDIALSCLCDLPILAPIRDLQGVASSPRRYEIDYLRDRGFAVSDAVSRYSINENILGVTISGSEIDTFDRPDELASRRLVSPRADWPQAPLRLSLGFEQGVAVSIDGSRVPGPDLLQELAHRFGAYGVGRSIYTGDTILGLKGRIVFEAPGLVALLTAHRALEQTILTREQGLFKPIIAKKWSELVYSGLFHEPLREDLERMIRSTQTKVTGEVLLETEGGSVSAVAVHSDSMLLSADVVYAQSAPWSAEEANGFIRMFGLSTRNHAARGIARSLGSAAVSA